MSKYMFDNDIFKQMNLETLINGKKDESKKFLIRPLSIDDYRNGFLEILAQLTKVGNVTEEQYEKQFKNMKESNTYFVTVIEDLDTGRVVGAGTLFTEYKFIHDTALRGRVEDVVVSDDCRGQGLGNVVIDTMKRLAQHFQCYKLTLDCNDEMIPFYERFGFKAIPGRANSMAIYYA